MHAAVTDLTHFNAKHWDKGDCVTLLSAAVATTVAGDTSLGAIPQATDMMLSVRKVALLKSVLAIYNHTMHKTVNMDINTQGLFTRNDKAKPGESN